MSADRKSDETKQSPLSRAGSTNPIWINDWASLAPDIEDGGVKHSGLGRLNGISAIDDFTEKKTICMSPGLMQA